MGRLHASIRAAQEPNARDAYASAMTAIATLVSIVATGWGESSQTSNVVHSSTSGENSATPGHSGERRVIVLCQGAIVTSRRRTAATTA